MSREELAPSIREALCMALHPQPDGLGLGFRV